MISLIVILIAVPIIVVVAVVKTVSGTGKNNNPSPPSGQDPIDKYMDENYADIDWLRKGKL